MVRTRADSPWYQVATHDDTTLDAALPSSGAQWVSTDYPVAGYSTSFGTDYVAQLPLGTVARCNPVNVPYGCWDNPLDRVSTATGPPTPIPPLPSRRRQLPTDLRVRGSVRPGATAGAG